MESRVCLYPIFEYYYALHIDWERQADHWTEKQLIERLTATASEITNIPEQFFTISIKEIPDENFGIGGKFIDEIKHNYKPWIP